MGSKYLSTLILFTCLSFASFSQAIKICESGTSGTVTYYTATAHFPISQSATVEWSIASGTILSFDNSNIVNGQATVQVQWNTQGPAQTISVYVRDANGMIQTGTLTANYNASSCYAYPANQTIFKGMTPCLIKAKAVCIGTKNPPPQTYQWQESGNDFIMWTDIPGATSQDYQPPMLDDEKLYRRKTTASGQTVYTNIAYATLAVFTPGELSTPNSTTIPYGQRPVIYATYSFGGMCQSLLVQNYTWEQSVNNSPWEIIGTTAYYPANAPVIKGNTRIRRRTMTCTGLEYSNILTFNVGYTSPNYENINYVRENTVWIKGVYSWEHADNLSIGDKYQTTTYQDGLGRKIQAVDKEASYLSSSNEWKDLVVPFEYDEAGREEKNYLAYPSSTNPGKFKTAPISEQQGFYNSTFQDAYGYSLKEFDNSPYNKVIRLFKPGSAWVGSQQYSQFSDELLNTTFDAVQKWNIAYTAGSIPSNNGAFPENEITKTSTTDEHGRKKYEYRDKFGNLILRKVQSDDVPTAGHDGWHCTYYVYDDFGKLRFIITPKAVKYLELNGWGALSNVANELCYRYEYDAKGRLIVSKSPGAGEEHRVYDSRDRIVFLQDENQRSGTYNNGVAQWSFILYDGLDNVVAKGLVNSSNLRVQMQDAVNYLNNGEVTLSISTNTTENIKVFNPVVGGSYCGSCSNIQYNVVQYYGGYNVSASMQDNFDNGFSVVYPLDDMMAYDARVLNTLTGKKVKVMDGTSGNYLSSTFYYNKKRALLQKIQWTLKGKQVITYQYDFAGRMISSNNRLTDNSTTYSIINKSELDKLGRLKTFSKKVNNAPDYKKLSDYEYDELGRIKSKRLGIDPVSGGSELEKLEFKYNIHGSIEGINKDFALKASGYNKWQHYFGEYLGYDNNAGKFAKQELGGSITGVIWNTQGDDEQRKYDFIYGNSGYLKDALFKQYDPVTSTWTNTKVDFTSSAQYDLNGNIKSLVQKGIVPGKSPQTIDDLVYTYRFNEWSNQLENVEEGANNTLGTLNGKLGDFKDDAIAGTGTADYSYDANGNIQLDENKLMKNLYNGKGIRYNHLNLANEIKIDGVGTEKYTYDGEGNKLEKINTPSSGSVTTTTYAYPFIFENNNLSLIITEEGRIRVITQYNNNNGVNQLQGNFQLPNGKWGVYDYFVKDHLQSTRVVLTEEVQSGGDVCTMETADATEKLRQEKQFGQIDPVTLAPAGNNEVVNSRVAKNGTGWNSNPSAWVSKLEKNSQKIGPNVILKVMAGDVIRAKACYFYLSDPGPANTTSIVNQILTSLLGAYATNGGPSLKGATADLNNNLLNPLTSFATQQMNEGTNLNAPQAYLNYIFFDEQMNFVAENSGCKRVEVAGDAACRLVEMNDVKAPKNGFVYVYLSNESVQPVYFDDFSVTHVRGRIVEENHYYPYGLPIAGISSKKLGDANNGTLQNRYRFQGKFAEENEFTSLNEYEFRRYDPQIGRWISPDPVLQYASAYIGMGNNPANGVDPDGSTFSDWLNAKLFAVFHRGKIDYGTTNQRRGNWYYIVRYNIDGEARARFFEDEGGGRALYFAMKFRMVLPLSSRFSGFGATPDDLDMEAMERLAYLYHGGKQTAEATARAVTPDYIKISAAGGAGGVSHLDHEESLTFILHGRDASFFPYYTRSTAVRIETAAGVQGSLSISFGRYLGKPEEVSKNMLGGKTHNFGLNGGLNEVFKGMLGISGEVGVNDKREPQTVATKASLTWGFGMGLPVSPYYSQQFETQPIHLAPRK